MKNRASNFNSGLGFGIGMAIYNILIDIITADNLSASHVVKILIAGIFAGTLSGVLFGWLMGKFLNSKYINQACAVEMEAGESILFETPANHFKGIEGVGGKLYLTSRRLIFKSHKLNFQNHQLDILLPDIQAFDRYRTLGIINNGLRVKNDQGVVEKFVVHQPEKWVQLISGAVYPLQ